MLSSVPCLGKTGTLSLLGPQGRLRLVQAKPIVGGKTIIHGERASSDSALTMYHARPAPGGSCEDEYEWFC